MNDEQVRSEIARLVCARFMNMHESTPRHMIVSGFECPELLDEMETRNLLHATKQRDDYVPTVGSFALLGDENESYQFARTAFERTAYALWNAYRCEGPGVGHESSSFEIYVSQFFPEPSAPGQISLGLFLAREFGILQAMRFSEDSLRVEDFSIAELAVKMRDPARGWNERVKIYREQSRPLSVPIDQLLAVAQESLGGGPTTEDFDGQGFWSLIHPQIEFEARSRFEGSHFADAVEAALKVVAQKVRDRTGLTTDGADLMHTAFSPRNPYLVFTDSIPATQLAMQQGYMELFAGAMTGIRNPKAHGIVKLDRRRAIHFLLLASLLGDKVDEAQDASRSTP